MTQVDKHSRTATEPSADGGSPWRSGVGLIILNDKNETLLCERADGNGWQWPQGGRDEGETAAVAAWRELQEEVGLTRAQAELLVRLPERTEYDFPDYILARHKAEDGKNSNGQWVQKYRGQRHDWFVFRLTSSDNAIQLDQHHEVEFSAYRWASPAEASAVSTDFKQPSYRKAVAMLEAWLGQ